MRRQRSALPLPQYTRRKPLAGGKWGYYFEPPSWARKLRNGDDRGPCPVGAEDLGADYDAAMRRVERVLLPAFHTWRTRGVLEPSAAVAPAGSLDWLFAEYRNTDKFRTLSKRMRKLHEDGWRLVSDYVLKDGRRLGTVKLTSIDTGVVDPLYERLLYIRNEKGEKIAQVDAAGEPIKTRDGGVLYRERRTTINHAMKSCRRAWNVVLRLHPRDVPALNPFARMGLRGADGVVPEATYLEMLAAVAQADKAGMPSLGTAIMLTWEWLQREEHVFTAFMLDHYRPKDRPHEVKIVHPKNGEAVWVPLFDAHGVALFPELMERLDALKKDRIGGLMFVRDWVDRVAKRPVPWVAPSGDLTYVRQRTKDVVTDAGLRTEITFTSFRHGGMTELGNSDLTDAQIRALSRQKSSKVLPRYIKRTSAQIIAGTHKRRATRQGAKP
jgi:hypothetical protein